MTRPTYFLVVVYKIPIIRYNVIALITNKIILSIIIGMLARVESVKCLQSILWMVENDILIIAGKMNYSRFNKCLFQRKHKIMRSPITDSTINFFLVLKPLMALQSLINLQLSCIHSFPSTSVILNRVKQSTSAPCDWAGSLKGADEVWLMKKTLEYWTLKNSVSCWQFQTSISLDRQYLEQMSCYSQV